MKLVERFLHYVSFDTQSDELTNMTPSTPGQMIFARELEAELRKIGLTEITLDDNGYLMATFYCPSRYESRHVGTACFSPYREEL